MWLVFLFILGNVVQIHKVNNYALTLSLNYIKQDYIYGLKLLT